MLGMELLYQRVRNVGARPLFVWWVVENLPDLRIPDVITRLLSGLRLAVDRRMIGRTATDDYRFTTGWLGSGQRFRIVGELRRLVSLGIIELIVVSGERRCELLRRQGLAAQPLFFGYASNFGRDLRATRDIDVAFLGQAGSRRRQRNLRLVTRALERRNISVAVHDGRNSSLSGEALIQFLNRCRVLLNILRGSQDAVFHRFLLGAANKALVVTEPVNEYGPFVPGEHLLVSPVGRMAETIERIVRDDEARNRYVEAAYHLVTCCQTMDASVERLLEMCNDLRLQRV
jgi:hypothetical protein